MLSGVSLSSSLSRDNTEKKIVYFQYDFTYLPSPLFANGKKNLLAQYNKKVLVQQDKKKPALAERWPVKELQNTMSHDVRENLKLRGVAVNRVVVAGRGIILASGGIEPMTERVVVIHFS